MQHQTLLCNSIKNTSGSVRRKVENRISSELSWRIEYKYWVVSVGLSVTRRWEYTLFSVVRGRFSNHVFPYVHTQGHYSIIAILVCQRTQSWSRHDSWKQLTSTHIAPRDRAFTHGRERAVRQKSTCLSRPQGLIPYIKIKVIYNRQLLMHLSQRQKQLKAQIRPVVVEHNATLSPTCC